MKKVKREKLPKARRDYKKVLRKRSALEHCFMMYEIVKQGMENCYVPCFGRDAK